MKTWLYFKIWFIVALLVGGSESLPIRASRNSSVPILRIVGGAPVDVQNYPYQASMQYSGRHICGASILSVNFVLTAAHCTYKVVASRIIFRAGTATRAQGGQVVKAKAVHQHPKFNYNTVDYDVAVVEVIPKFVYNEKLKNVGIANTEPREGSTVTASGWGTIRETSNRIANELRAVEIPVVSRANCQKAYFRRAVITARMICAGNLIWGGKDTCQGDSGGPLISNGKLAGVVSWGFGCGRSKYPGVYNKEIRSYVKQISGI